MNTGTSQCILSYYIQGKSYPYPSRNEILEDMPALKKKFLYYKDYAVARMSDIFTPDQRAGMTELQVKELKNGWLENTGEGTLLFHELPPQAQFSAIQGAVVTDVNGDGQKEIFTAGNFYPFRVQLGREDAGKGLLLQWDASKHVLTPSPISTGIIVDGDVRDLVEITTAGHRQQIIVSKNNDSIQVIQTTFLRKNK